jgi:hypothetical protein
MHSLISLPICYNEATRTLLDERDTGQDRSDTYVTEAVEGWALAAVYGGSVVGGELLVGLSSPYMAPRARLRGWRYCSSAAAVWIVFVADSWMQLQLAAARTPPRVARRLRPGRSPGGTVGSSCHPPSPVCRLVI